MRVPRFYDGLEWEIQENPKHKWMITGGTPILGNPHIRGCSICKRGFPCPSDSIVGQKAIPHIP